MGNSRDCRTQFAGHSFGQGPFAAARLKVDKTQNRISTKLKLLLISLSLSLSLSMCVLNAQCDCASVRVSVCVSNLD